MKPVTDKEILSDILSMIDLTSLDGTDSDKTTTALCRKAMAFGDLGLPVPASVCIFSPFIRIARQELTGTGIRIATVAGGFPHGQIPLNVKLEEVAFAIDQGTDEIDLVFSRGRFLAGDHQQIFEEIAAVRDACESITLKVILETGELATTERIAEASDMALRAGADFIKTSTGKISDGASEQGVKIMLDRILSYYNTTGMRRGIKPSGGIADAGQAMMFYGLVSSMLGESWLSKKYVRFGASRLAGTLAEKILNL